MDNLAERLEKMTPLQRAIFALKETQARLDALERKQAEPIAIVGMACRFPGGANDPPRYWRLLRDGVDAIHELPRDRWDFAAFYDPDPSAPGKTNIRYGGFLDQVDLFDNHFFGISDREALRLDPQQRLLLELTWEALEDAGLPPAGLRGSRTAVYVGISLSDYGIMQAKDPAYTDAYAATGGALCMAANRLSFHFGWLGPSMALDTACSSSLVAVHLACQSMRNGEAELAVAAGVNMLLSPVGFINVTKAGLGSADGRVRSFDAGATGYVRSEGAGVVVLKPLDAALRDRDPIHAVIRGSAVNQNGCHTGLTVPSRPAQEQVLRDAYRRAGTSPGQVQYIEAQATGTPLGDAIEATALGSVLGEGRSPGGRCAIGSVKTNLGHMETASGMASLIKTALCLQHRQLPPTLHFTTPNPNIPLADLPLRVVQQLEPWPDTSGPRLAGVSGFGYGGCNAHVVLEEAPVPADSAPASSAVPGRPTLLVLSARTDQALADLATAYAEFLGSTSSGWSDICFTAAFRREHHDCRLAILADSAAEACRQLANHPPGTASAAVAWGRKPFGREPKIGWLFSGQTDAWRHCGAALADWQTRWASAADDIRQLDASLQQLAGWPLPLGNVAAGRWHDRAYALPTSFALQWALSRWWQAAGVAPNVVLGRGAGVLAAATVAGLLQLDEALRIAVAWGRDDDPTRNMTIPARPEKVPLIGLANRHSPEAGPGRWQKCPDEQLGLSDAVSALSQRGLDIGLEISPTKLLEMLAEQTADRRPGWIGIASLAAAPDGTASLLTALGQLHCAGVPVAPSFLAPASGQVVRLPSYPWQRRRLWVEGMGWQAGRESPADIRGNGRQLASTPSATASSQETAAAAFRPRPDLNTPFFAPESALERAISQAWCQALRLDRVGVYDNFFELGGDSLQATVLLNGLRARLGDVIEGHVLFQVQSIRELTNYLVDRMPDIEQRLQKDEPTDLEPHATSVEPVSQHNEPRNLQPIGAGADAGIPRLPRDMDADELLAHFDDLSDAQVERLLKQAQEDSEATDG